MKFVCCIIRLRKILYKYGLNHSLYNTVMNLYLTVCRCVRSTSELIYAIFSERGGQLFFLFFLCRSLTVSNIAIVLLSKSSLSKNRQNI